MSVLSGLTVFFNRPFVARTATLTPIICYPLACISFVILPDSQDMVGVALMVATMIGFTMSMATYIKRIAFSPRVDCFVGADSKLDELERDLRSAAYSFSFKVLVLLNVAGMLYMTIAADAAASGKSSLWMPRVDDQWLAILFGVVLLSILLPMNYLAWNVPNPVSEDEFEDAIIDKQVLNIDETLFVLAVTGISLGFAYDKAWLLLSVGSALWLLLRSWFSWFRRRKK